MSDDRWWHHTGTLDPQSHSCYSKGNRPMPQFWRNHMSVDRRQWWNKLFCTVIYIWTKWLILHSPPVWITNILPISHMMIAREARILSPPLHVSVELLSILFPRPEFDCVCSLLFATKNKLFRYEESWDQKEEEHLGKLSWLSLSVQCKTEYRESKSALYCVAHPAPRSHPEPRQFYTVSFA